MTRIQSCFVLGVFLVACQGKPDHEVAAWRAVLARKSAIDDAAPEKKTAARQAYADALRSFCKTFPDHTRAREVYQQLELDHARDLIARGDYDGASLFYQSVLRETPQNAAIRQEWADAMKHRFVTRDAMANLQRGMRPREVAERLGPPSDDWTRTIRKRDTTLVSWYYPRSDGGVGGVYFKDGRLFAAEYDRMLPLKDAD